MSQIFLGSVVESLKEVGLEAGVIGKPESILVESRFTGRSWKFTFTTKKVFATEINEHGIPIGKYEGIVENESVKAVAFSVIRLLARRMLSGEVSRTKEFTERSLRERLEAANAVEI